MPNSEKLTELGTLLSSSLIRERRAGIFLAQEMLARNESRERVRKLLNVIAKKDLIGTIRTDAQNVLDADNAYHNPPPPKIPAYIFTARCPKGHVNNYDKREYCPKNSNFPRRAATHGNRNVDEILLRCKSGGCGEEFYVEIDCEGYK